MPQEIYELGKGLARIKIKIDEMKRDAILPLVIGVAGGSGSGKTTKVAKQIKKIFPESKILSMDDYFRGKKFMDSIDSKNWDDPAAIDFDLLCEHLIHLRQGLVIQKPIYSFEKSEREGLEKFEPSEIIILEGLFVFNDAIEKFVNLKIFVETSVHGSLLRRILRDVGRTGQTEKDIFSQYVNTVYPMHKLYVEPTKTKADIVIINQYSPEIETDKCESREIQIKAVLKKNLSRQKLDDLGFCKIGIVSQEDIYYTSSLWKDSYSEELMRIRIENGRYFLAYKGPLSGSLLRIKPKIEFEVDPHLKDALEDLGYKKIFTLQKEREIWLGVGIELVVDEIKKRGTFIEFRTPNPRGEEEISNCLKKIGIEEKLITKKSYFELFSK